MVVFRATCAVRVPGALGRGGQPACKARVGQLCSCVHMVQHMTFRARNVLRVHAGEGTSQSAHRRVEPLQRVGRTQHSPVCAAKPSESRSDAPRLRHVPSPLEECLFQGFVTILYTCYVYLAMGVTMS